MYFKKIVKFVPVKKRSSKRNSSKRKSFKRNYRRW